MSYNVKVFKYSDGSFQVRSYLQTVKSGENAKNQNEYDFGFNPFDNQPIKKILYSCEEPPDLERSSYESYRRTKNKIYQISRANTWDYFVTLTFDPNKIDSTNYDIVSKCVSEWLHTIKRYYCKDLKYIIVPELHKDGKKFHFHALFANCDNLPLIYSGHKIRGQDIYNLKCYHKGFTTVSRVQDSKRVSSYICKYITKDLCILSKGKKRYWSSRNCDLPIITEHNFDDLQFNEFMKQYEKNITYTKSVKCQLSNNLITYYEVDNS